MKKYKLYYSLSTRHLVFCIEDSGKKHQFSIAEFLNDVFTTSSKYEMYPFEIEKLRLVEITSDTIDLFMSADNNINQWQAKNAKYTPVKYEILKQAKLISKCIQSCSEGVYEMLKIEKRALTP